MSSIEFSRAAPGVVAFVRPWGQGNGHIFLGVIGLMALLLVTYGVIRSVYRIWFHPLRNFPGPPLLAVTYFPYLYTNYIRGAWVRKMDRLHRKYGPAIRIGPNHIAVDGSIGWPDVYSHRKAGQQEFTKLPGILPGDQQGLITAPKEVHRRQRRQLSHAFSDSALVQQESTIKTYVDMLLERLSDRAKEGQEFNIVPWLNFTTFDIIGDLAFSDSFHSLANNGYHPWVRLVSEGIRGIAILRFFQVYPLIGIVADCFGVGTKSKSLVKVRTHAKDKARARMALGEEPVKGQKDFMTYMLRKTREGGEGMAESEILATSPTLVVAGSETTASALSAFCFYLPRNKRVYDILANEVRSNFNREDEITLRSLSSMQYLQAVIEEILRVYPPAAETPARLSPGDMVAGRYVPAGTRVSVYQWATFRNPDNFVEPNSFIPERWLPETHPRYEKRFKADNKAVFKPFSHGSRDCIGKNLAQAEMRYIIARLLSRFDIDLAFAQDDWHDKQRTFVVWEKGPLYVRLTAC